MKTLVAAAAIAAFVPATVLAQAEEAPMMDSAIIVEEAASSSAVGIIVPIIMVAILGIALSSGGGGGYTPPAAATLSDFRLKTDIKPVGVGPGGLTLYHYRYIGGETVYRGVMAQDVQRVRPDAVVKHPLGFLMVDYDRLGLELVEIE